MSPLSPLLFTVLLLGSCCWGYQDLRQVLSTRSIQGDLQTQTIRSGFTSDFGSNVALLQEDGLAEDSFSVFLQLQEGTVDDLTFLQSSSNHNVLDISSSPADLLTSVSSSGNVNVTVSLSFDGFVGKTDYSLTARNKTTGEDVASITISYTIVGITFYTESDTGEVTIVSGDMNKFVVSYEAALSRSVSDDFKIRTLIQYADGSTSTALTQDAITNGDSLTIRLLDLEGQVVYSTEQCKSSEISSENQDATVAFRASCGLGFYKDSAGNLNFGINFEPYRAGAFVVQFSWSGVATGDPRLAEQSFETRLNVEITGKPPVAVLSLAPSDKIWRPEGGELVTVDIINAINRNIALLQLKVDNLETPFQRLYGSEVESGAPEYKQTVSFITEPGFGTGLTWTLEYQEVNADGSLGPIQTAAFVPGFAHVFSSDSTPLRIDAITPDFGPEEGGDVITISGHFPFFNADLDGVLASGYQLPGKYIHSVSDSVLSVEIPPRSELGGSYEFDLKIKMGNALSNPKIYSFEVKGAKVRISQTGTSEIAAGTYRLGNCTYSSFTAIVTPLTNQIQSYKWSLSPANDANTDLLSTSAFSASNSSAQTLEFDSDVLDAGAYTLKISVALLGKDIDADIDLMREHVVSIGAFILHAPERTVASPDSPLRLSAVVKSPGACYTGNQTMMFEWSAFNDTKLFSSTNATGSSLTGSFSQTPARLGWEYVVPREQLSAGTHEIVFRVWMAEDERVSGQATSDITINRSPLVPVIRFGEEQVTVNYLTTLNLFASRSYDPDVLGGDQTAGMTYVWSCRQSTSEDFYGDGSSPCLEALLPSTDADSFDADFSVLRVEGDVQHVQYRLQVKKDTYISVTTMLTVEVQDRGTRPFLTDYQISLTNADGIKRDWVEVAHYERAIISVAAAPAASWSYSLLEPSIPDFFSSARLINSPLFFSAEADLFTVSGNTKPLGIEAGALRPRTTYRFKIMFDGGEDYEMTSVVVSLTSLEAPVVRFPVPSITEGTTNTVFTVTAGVPTVQTVFSYYFMLTDDSGGRFCLGGCTGYDVAYFRVGRPGSYSITAYIYDMQGKALLDSKTLPKNITVSESGDEDQYLSHLVTLFAIGDDSTWTQFAHDMAQLLLNGETVPMNTRTGSETTRIESSPAPEDLLADRMQAALEISDGARKIFCSSFPNSFHGTDCVNLASDLAQQSLLDTEAIYNIMVMVECCVQNTPIRTIKRMGSAFPGLLDNLNRIALSIDQGGLSRRRLLRSAGEPANLFADVQSWTSRQMSASVTSGQLDGFVATYPLGENMEYGQISIVVSSNPGHLPTQVVNGEQRRVVPGPSENELFYASDTCLSKMFAESADKQRFIVLHTVDNFITMGFQDPPEGSNIGESLYWAKMFEEDNDGRFVPVELAKEEPCYCWRMLISQKQQFLEESVDYMAGMFSVTDMKEFGVDVTKGEAYTYVYDGVFTSEYNASEGWVEACQNQLGLVGPTLVPRSSNNAVGNTGGTVFGTGTVALVGLVIGGLVFVVVAMASVWVFVARAVSDVATPLAALSPHDLYVERDVYGRATIFDMNAVNLPPPGAAES